MLGTVSSVAFACFEKACAPPPAGRGGSSGSSGGSETHPKDAKFAASVSKYTDSQVVSEHRYWTARAKGAEQRAILRALEAERSRRGLPADATTFACQEEFCGLTAACYEASCRPPTSGGTGGSKGGIGPLQTSVVPRDTRPKVRASDDHPKAPGADDLTAVRGHRGMSGTDPERRIPRAGETVDAYRDLGHGREFKRGFPDGAAMSVRHASGNPGDRTGLVVASATGLVVTDARPAWATAAKKAAELTGKRGVHAFVRGEVKEYVNPDKLLERVKSEPGWEKVTYYPGTEDFFQPGSRRRFLGSDEGALVNGEFYAKNARFHESTAPVSKIEQKMGLTASRIGRTLPPCTTSRFPQGSSNYRSR